MIHILAAALTVLAASCQAQEPAADKPLSKWYPGHYMLLPANHPREAWAVIADDPHFAGGQRIYTWRELEPERDKYDFSAVEQDLAYLQAHGKRLILEIWDTTFHGGVGPAPDYLLTDPQFAGGVRPAPGKERVIRAKRWLPAVSDRYLALVAALGKRFDSEPYFAGLIHTETAMEADGPAGGDFSAAGYDRELRRWVEQSRVAFPTTPVIIFGNWYPYRGQQGLADLGRLAVEKGVGWGGPDLCPGTGIWGYQVIRENAGKMPLGLSVQWQSYDGRWTAQQLLDGAAELKLNFIFWGNFDRRNTGGLSFSKDIIPALAAHGDCLTLDRPGNLDVLQRK